MKRFFYALTLLMMPVVASFAQVPTYFIFQSDGSFKTEDGKSFVVVEKPGLTAEQLYDMILNKATMIYVSPKDVISKVENSSIAIFGKSPMTIKSKSTMGGE